MRFRSAALALLLSVPLLGIGCAEAGELGLDDDNDIIGTDPDAGDRDASTGRGDGGSATPPRGSSSSGDAGGSSSGDAGGSSSSSSGGSGSSSSGSSSGGTSCTTATCANAENLGVLAGDGGSTADFSGTTATGRESKWLKLRVKDTIDGGTNISWSMHFTPAPGVQYEIRILKSQTCGGAGTLITGTDFSENWTDASAGADDRYYLIEIRQVGGTCPSTQSWSLDIDGNTF